MNTTPLTILNKVLKHWTAERATTVVYARTATGKSCSWRSRTAVCWCALGALLRASKSDRVDPATDEIIQVSCNVLYPTRPMCLVRVNDEYGYPAARAILEHARDSLTPR